MATSVSGQVNHIIRLINHLHAQISSREGNPLDDPGAGTIATSSRCFNPNNKNVKSGTLFTVMERVSREIKAIGMENEDDKPKLLDEIVVNFSFELNKKKKLNKKLNIIFSFNII
ncbi:hypothetical protein F8M41_002565 [Gigaspora margarita]|uniref:Uncharacterized protein n=1 Tax=Gigaspora margarita TaxID=4874 RepID=A0A8H4ESD9_GIGMA|nr:hypothetical protein F8M41_002565 [Gigaspora margarita]